MTENRSEKLAALVERALDKTHEPAVFMVAHDTFANITKKISESPDGSDARRAWSMAAVGAEMVIENICKQVFYNVELATSAKGGGTSDD